MWRAFWTAALSTCAALSISTGRVDAAASDWKWWPPQAVPAGIVEIAFDKSESGRDQRILAESLAGLAAQAVNAGRGDELVWIGAADRPAYETWRTSFLARTGVRDRGSVPVWRLAEAYAKAGIVKGYILYTPDEAGDGKRPPAEMNHSLNAATMAAGILDGILVTPEMEGKAAALHLPLLLDARQKSEAWAFAEYRDRLNKDCLLLQKPGIPYMRDLAIAQRMATVYTMDEPLSAILSWMNPKGVVVGWYSRDEGQSVGKISRSGHAVVAADWAMNLPVLSAGASTSAPVLTSRPLPPADRVEREAASPCAAYMLSDGDNLQWMLSRFVDGTTYWNSPDRGKVPFGWTTCPGDLMAVAPDAWDYLRRTLPESDGFVAHAGYFYPDLLGVDLGPSVRSRLLQDMAHRIAGMMEATDCYVLTFLCMDVKSEAAREAYRVFAHEIPGLEGILPIQYDPYEGGKGEVFWESDGRGGEIPIITCRYSIWAKAKGRPLAGGPVKVARLIQADAVKDPSLAAWTIIHAWSSFQPGNDDPEQEGALGDGAEMAVGAALHSAQALSGGVTVVNPRELVWITRWRHDPAGTRARLSSPVP